MKKHIGVFMFIGMIMLSGMALFQMGTAHAQVDPFAPPPPPPPRIPCPYCDEVFHSQSALDAHISEQHSFECPYCDEVLRSQSAIDSHIVSEHRLQLITNSGEIITDSHTGLQWRLGPDQPTSWNAAKAWVEGLGGNWRMPTRAELRGLWDAGISSNNWGPFENSGSWVWSGEVRDSSSACSFTFSTGCENWTGRSRSPYDRAFAVRPR